ncbi:MAG: rhodanese-like domain-containing protein [Rhodobacterales bacterium]|nr:rhodanese-like domain-containing protein [Rhodobacterales bacterium]
MHKEPIGQATLEHWTPEDVKAALDRREILLIDVRTPQEYLFEKIPGALLLPMAEFDATILPAQSDRTVVFHCGSGMRSRKVAEAWIAAGHARACHLEGGFAAWKTAALPYLGTDPATGFPRKVGG